MRILRLLGLENPIVPLRKEADAGDPDAQFLLAEAYLAGGDPNVLPRDDEQAVHFYQKAADQDHPEAQAKLGELYWGGNCGLPKDVTKAAYWYRRAERNGHHEALVSLALIHSNADGPHHRLPDLSNEELFALHKKGAELNLSFCQYELGTLYLEGKVTTRDLVKAHAWYKVAAENGHRVWQSRWDELIAQMTPEEKAQAYNLANQLRAHLEAERRTREQQRENCELKPWRLEAAKLGKKRKTLISDARLFLQRASSVEGRISGLSAIVSSLVVYVPAALVLPFLVPAGIPLHTAVLILVGGILYFKLLNLGADGLYWRIYQRRRLVSHFTTIMTSARMPQRLYAGDGGIAYVRRILGSDREYDRSEIPEKVIATARDIEEELKQSVDTNDSLNGGRSLAKIFGCTREIRVSNALDEALEAYSPADSAPPHDGFAPVCEWINQAASEDFERLNGLTIDITTKLGVKEATLEELARSGQLAIEVGNELGAARPFRKKRDVYSALCRRYRNPTHAKLIFLAISNVSANWDYQPHKMLAEIRNQYEITRKPL